MANLNEDQEAVLRELTEMIEFNKNGFYHVSGVSAEVDTLLDRGQELGIVKVVYNEAPEGTHGDVAAEYHKGGRKIQLSEDANAWRREQKEGREEAPDRR